MRQGQVYFLAGAGRIKIGFSSHLQQRLVALRALELEPLDLLAAVDGTFELERSLHHHLRDFRVKGEWFEDCERVRAAIEEARSGKIPIRPLKRNYEGIRPRKFVPDGGPTFDEITVARAAIKEASEIGNQMMGRVFRREDISGLVDRACILMKQIAPIMKPRPEIRK